MKKIVLYNFLVLFLLFFILEFVSYILIKNDAKDYMENYNKYAKSQGLDLLTQRYSFVKTFNQEDFDYRKTQLGNTQKPTILFLGCSYIYGSMNIEEHTLPFIINKYADVTTVNRGIPGGGILNSLHDLNDNNFYDGIKDLPPIKYIIYLYIFDQQNRISNPYRGTVMPNCFDCKYDVNPMFNRKNGKIFEEQPSKLKLFLYSLYTTKAYYYYYKEALAKEKKSDKMIALLKEAKRITDEKFPNSQFIILQYKDGGHNLLENNEKEELIKDGFIILDSEKLAGHELESEIWRSEDKEHPNYAAFDDVAKGLIKELKL